MIQYPVLVYGTLRPGCGNYEAFLRGNTVHEQEVRVDGFVMHGHSGFPYIVRGDGSIVATLVYVAPDLYEKVVQGLDYLEGFREEGSSNNHYDRVLHTFVSEGVTYSAYIYVAENEFSKSNAATLPVIESGDWVEHQKELRKENVWR